MKVARSLKRQKVLKHKFYMRSWTWRRACFLYYQEIWAMNISLAVAGQESLNILLTEFFWIFYHVFSVFLCRECFKWGDQIALFLAENAFYGLSFNTFFLEPCSTIWSETNILHEYLDCFLSILEANRRILRYDRN